MSAKGVDAEEDRGGIKASLLHVLGEESRKLYITLFLFRKKKTCAKRKMNRKVYIMGETNILHSSVSSIGWERRRGALYINTESFKYGMETKRS